MLVIRLMRTGKKNQPFFRFVVTEKKNPSTAGRTTEILGFYNPLTKEKKINTDRVKYWLSVGAKPSDTVFNVLVSEKIIEGKKIPQHKKSKHAPVAAKPAVTAPAAEKEPEVKAEPAPVEISAGREAAVEEKEEIIEEKPAESAEPAESAKPEESVPAEPPADTQQT